MNKGIIYLIIAVVVIGALMFFSSAASINYFDNNAPVIYFYRDGCHVCDFIKPALEELGNEGYKVRPFDVAAYSVPAEYDLTGTPTFFAPDGEKIVGIEKDETVDEFKLRLQEFLDKYWVLWYG